MTLALTSLSAALAAADGDPSAENMRRVNTALANWLNNRLDYVNADTSDLWMIKDAFSDGAVTPIRRAEEELAEYSYSRERSDREEHSTHRVVGGRVA